MENELTPFDYGTVDAFEADRLKQHEAVILKSAKKMSDAAYEIGEELQAAHDELANHKNGTFFAWCESIGIKRTQAQDFMSYHDFIYRNAVNKSKLESLPKRLIVDANRPSTPQELKDKVASGDVTTLPQFKKLKAELEATKNVLRTTESKLDAAQKDAQSIHTTLDAVNVSRSRDKEDFQKKLDEKDAELQSLKNENTQYKANFSQQVATKVFELQAENTRAKEQAEKERDDAQAEAASLREKADAYDDLQKTNHSLREKIRQQADELANRPNVETVVTKEVIPDEYKKAFMENQRMRKELATYKAHSQGQTLQELAQIDKEYADLEKSYDEEEKACQRLEQFAMLPYFYPDGPIEARELVRCYMKFHGAEEAAVNSMIESIDHARDAMEWIGDALKNARKQMEKFDKTLNRPALEVVK